MKSELIIDVRPNDVSIALLEDSRLVSLQKEQRNIAYAVGDIYLAKVKKLMPGLNAAFVNVGYEKDAFLHYLDLGPHFASYDGFVSALVNDKKHIPLLSKTKLLPDIDKNGSIAERLQQGKNLLVQIVKEPISSKGPRLTTELSFTGRYLVLIPFSDKISVSQKIRTTEEKLRLRQLVDSIKPKNFGVIIRTSAEGKRVAELNHELKTLVKCWEDTLTKAQAAEAPSLVFEEESRIVGMLRDVFSPSFEAIHVNDPETFEQIRKYVDLIAPDRNDIVKLYSKPEPIFDSFGITRQIKSSFGKTVSFKSGAYIIIEHTEALHVIDVNSGNRTKATNDQETNALEVNLRAADEIARQLRLRDMGGIIVVDFIDMAKNEHRQELYDHMKEIMQGDRARHNILPLSKFGLMQITRQRVRPVLDIPTDETCPSCHGTGKIQPSLLFTDTLFEKLEYVSSNLNIKGFTLYVHPYVEAYLRKGWLNSIYRRWKRSLDSKFDLVADQSLAYLEYRVIDRQGNEINLVQEKDTGAALASKKNEKSAARSATIDITPELEEAADAAQAAAREAKLARAAHSQMLQARAAEAKAEKQKAAEAKNAKKAAEPAKISEAPEAAEATKAKKATKTTKAKDATIANEATKDQATVENTEAPETTPAESGADAEKKPSRSARRRARQRAAKAAAKAAAQAADNDAVLASEPTEAPAPVAEPTQAPAPSDPAPASEATVAKKAKSAKKAPKAIQAPEAPRTPEATVLPEVSAPEVSADIPEAPKPKPARARRAKARRADGSTVIKPTAKPDSDSQSES